MFEGYDETKIPEYYKSGNPNQELDMANFPYDILEDKYVLIENTGTIKEKSL
ncbi:hypothetical protein [Clostridium diolis]|uniref:hypothetical protein n=1 Tax=Clostridium diolis TaxID=223919 RepID=UPI0015C6546C|nr:hypothetical protein [Clostridium diolis]